MQLEEERQKYSKRDGLNPDIIGLENGSDLQLIEMQSRYMVTVLSYSSCREDFQLLLLCTSSIVSDYIVEQISFPWSTSLHRILTAE